jgi:hypothetical protein
LTHPEIRGANAVHGDVIVLPNAGVLDRTAGGQIECPVDPVKIGFTLKAE